MLVFPQFLKTALGSSESSEGINAMLRGLHISAFISVMREAYIPTCSLCTSIVRNSLATDANDSLHVHCPFHWLSNDSATAHKIELWNCVQLVYTLLSSSEPVTQFPDGITSKLCIMSE